MLPPDCPHSRSRSRRLLALAAIASTALLLTACAPWRVFTAAELAREARPYTASPEHPTRRLLVVGDSTAVGTGADAPADSLVGLIGQAQPQWHIDNLATNGARYADVARQLREAPGGYDLVLVLAGGNDVIRFTAEDRLRTDMEDTLSLARERGTAVVLMPCGNVGHAPFFVPPLSWAMSRRSKRLHGIAQDAAARHAARYVRLLKPREQDPFVQHSAALHAADGLHPSSAGYAEWFGELVSQGGLAGITP